MSPPPPARSPARSPADALESAPPLERHAGIVLSTCFHLVLFGWLIARTEPPELPFVEPPPIRVELSPVEPPPPQEIVRAMAPAPNPPELAATADAESEAPPGEHPGVAAPEASPDGESVLRPGEAASEEPAVETPEDAVEDAAESFASFEEPESEPQAEAESEGVETEGIEAEDETDVEIAETPSPLEPASRSSRDAEARREEEMALLKEILDEQRDDISRAADRRLTEQGSAEVEERLRLAAVDQSAKKWLRTDDGRREGIVRGLDTSGVPDSVAQGVLGRYGIKILIKQLDGSARGLGYDYLNQAKTGSEVYYQRAGAGVYKVFSYGQGAIARMMQLETDEIVRQGYDPASARVLEVQFGIVAVPGGYDLGVQRIRIEPMMVDAEPEPGR